MLKLSLCLTTFNRPQLTIEAFEKVYTDPRIDEIVIVDDCSDIANYDMLHRLCDRVETKHGIIKIKTHRNATNLGMSRNKARAIELAKNDWCILFDSDNVLDASYLDALEKNPLGMRCDVIYCPVFAKPNFDYRCYENECWGAEEARKEIKSDAFNMAMNTCNYVVHRQLYLNNYQYNEKHIASDTIWFNYNWLNNGNDFYFVPGMEYEHRVHKDSGYMQNVHYNLQQSAEVRKLIAAL